MKKNVIVRDKKGRRDGKGEEILYEVVTILC